MKPFWEKVEYYNSKLIPYCLVALLLIIIIDIFVHPTDNYVKLAIEITDYLVLLVFIIDLVFLGIKAKSIRFFFQRYWIDIIAVIPIALIFTVVSYVYRTAIAVERIVVGQHILHETIEAERGISAITRAERLSKYSKIVMRGLRVITKSRLFDNLSHHVHKRKIHRPKRKGNKANIKRKR